MTRPASSGSLKRQLIGIAVAITLVAGLCGFGVTQVASLRESERIHDDGLQLVARLLMGLSEHELTELSPNATLDERVAMGRGDTADTFGGKYRYQIWSKQGQFLLGNYVSKEGTAMGQPGTAGYRWVDMDGERWRLFVMEDAQRHAEIHVAESQSARAWHGSVRHIFLMLVLPSVMLVLLPALWLQSRALRPLGDLARDLRERSPADLHEVRQSTQLAELQPVLAALNTLFGRVADAIRRESSFTALAAHEMRTPLATMRIVAEGALNAPDGPSRQLALNELLNSVDRCSHLQDQLLTLARLETGGAQRLDERFAMVELVDEALSTVTEEARDKSLQIQVDVDDTVMLGYRFGVSTLLRNLVSNAVRYAPAEGSVKVTTSRSGPDVIVRVEDSGPGIAPEWHSRAFERFDRLNATSGSGVGLGLSIARSVALLHGSEPRLDTSPLGGLMVLVNFPGRAVLAEHAGIGEMNPPGQATPTGAGTPTARPAHPFSEPL